MINEMQLQTMMDMAAALGNPQPRGKIPRGCYWDPRPGEAEGTWRRRDSHEVYDPKAVEKRRNASRRYEPGAKRRAVAQRTRSPLFAHGECGCCGDGDTGRVGVEAMPGAASDACAECDECAECEGASFDVPGVGRLNAILRDAAGVVGMMVKVSKESLAAEKGSTRCRVEGFVSQQQVGTRHVMQ